ncbi:hypothetical protein S40293_05283 [Stachybotrys chartarum IBT 40293]|nr:hypothetical protein S40293_05283 [Stachybotrys chartarum IBT 40293]
MAAVVEKTQQLLHHDSDNNVDPEKSGGIVESTPTNVSSDADSERFQDGVQRVRGVTSVWSQKTMWIMFVLLFIVSFVDMIIVSMQYSLNPFITSSFGEHGLMASVGIVSSILSGCSQLTLAKIIDVFGRIEGFIFMLLLNVISLIMKATCNTMEEYYAAHTLYWVGHIGLMFVSFLGPLIAEAFYENINFRWAYGSLAIVLVGVCLPPLVIMLWEQRKAYRNGTLERKPKSGRNILQSFKYYVIEFDAVGLILITAAFSLFLLPFSIATRAPQGWGTPYIIGMIVTGILLFPIFYVWEWKLAPVQFIPWKYLKEPTILGSCALYAVMFISTFCWNGYFYSYLQVVHRLQITTASYTLNAYSLSSAILAPFVGLLIRYTGSFKMVAYIGVPFMMVGTALLIPFRTPSTDVGLLVLTQVFVGIGAGLFATCAQLAVMVPVTHQEIASVNALFGMFGSVGSSIGLAIAGAIWNQMLPHQLNVRLPEESKDQSATIFGDMVLQMSFPDGSAERDAIVGAYGYVQRLMVIAGVCFMPLCLLTIYVWRGVNVKKIEAIYGKQTKGTVW